MFFAEAEFRPNFGFEPKKKISAAKNFSARISAETEIRRFSVSPKFAPKMLKILSNIDFCLRELVSSISPWTGIVANYAYFDSSRESVPCRNHNGSKIPFLRWENRLRSLGCFLESSHPSSSRVIGCWGPFLSLPDGPMDADDDAIMILWKVWAFISSTGKYEAGGFKCVVNYANARLVNSHHMKLFKIVFLLIPQVDARVAQAGWGPVPGVIGKLLELILGTRLLVDDGRGVCL